MVKANETWTDGEDTVIIASVRNGQIGSRQTTHPKKIKCGKVVTAFTFEPTDDRDFNGILEGKKCKWVFLLVEEFEEKFRAI
jgi:hypothetical protein